MRVCEPHYNESVRKFRMILPGSTFVDLQNEARARHMTMADTARLLMEQQLGNGISEPYYDMRFSYDAR